MHPRHADGLISELAAGQHGLVTRRQLLSAGIRPWIVASRVAAKRLRPLHRGVYQVGPLTAPDGTEMAAVLACGPGAVVSHRSAGALWEMLPPRPDGDPVETVVAGRDRTRRSGIHAHRVRRLEPREVSKVRGIPVTAPARTLLDLAAVAAARELEQAWARAERKELTTREEVEALIGKRPNRQGIGRLRALLETGSRAAFTRSKAEERLLALVRKARLPVPETNVVAEGYELDFLWRRQRLVVEVDGYAFHSSRRKFENDRLRDADLAAHGLQVVRVTWRQLVEEPEATLVRLAQALVAR